ncbi:unnamed protein product, partial [Iphiclides podalirius]
MAPGCDTSALTRHDRARSYTTRDFRSTLITRGDCCVSNLRLCPVERSLLIRRDGSQPTGKRTGLPYATDAEATQVRRNTIRKPVRQRHRSLTAPQFASIRSNGVYREPPPYPFIPAAGTPRGLSRPNLNDTNPGRRRGAPVVEGAHYPGPWRKQPRLHLGGFSSAPLAATWKLTEQYLEEPPASNSIAQIELYNVLFIDSRRRVSECAAGGSMQF